MSTPYNILIVDDEPIVGDRLKRHIEKDGHKVEAYHDPRQAFDRLGEKGFDIVITDIRMGEVDGLQILEAALAASGQCKVIIITGYASLELARESLTKGAFDFIAKPFKLGEIRKTVRKAVQVLDLNQRQTASNKTFNIETAAK